MDGKLIPGKDLLLTMEPWYRNCFENTATVQFDHRVLATSTLLGITAVSLVLDWEGSPGGLITCSLS